ncbi:MAG: hypothetical protein PHE48_00820 [Candidatus Daviesbacteria bacterium]|nr:hypothetical protein [Candidatus Daviesbacteria bacterium]
MSLLESEPTPQELKTKVIQIFNQLPFAFPNPHPEFTQEELSTKATEMETTYRRRYDSQYTRKLVGIMGRLIVHSRPYTTRGFRRYLALEFDSKCEFGIDKENPSTDNVYLLLGLDFPDNYSIFDSKIVPILERRGYKALSMSQLAMRQEAIEASDKFLNLAHSRPGFHDHFMYLSAMNKERAEDPYHKNLLANWRTEYIARWGDEP